jgi:hypothetical protein
VRFATREYTITRGGKEKFHARLELARSRPGPGRAENAYREMQDDYAQKLSRRSDTEMVQREWLERLASFVRAHPRAKDTPDALLQLGLGSELVNKDAEAMRWYAQLMKNFPGTAQSSRAAGAIRRLELEGNRLHLAAPLLSDPHSVFDVDELRGKVVVVYYWASWNAQAAADFARLKALVGTYGRTNMGVVCVNLDNSADEARDFLSKYPTPGTQVHRPGGLDGKLATDYGIMVLPQIFLLGRDGKVVSRNGQLGTLEGEIKKHL